MREADKLPIRPRARILVLLGDQLIASPRLAVFELVKNAYDADAENVSVTLEGIDGEEPVIEIVDDGEGMTFETIRDIWLVPGDDHRQKQRLAHKRTPLGRLPIGEKGLGRFAVHKLGDKIQMITRHKNSKVECRVEIDWRTIVSHKLLEDARVEVHQDAPAVFKGSATGTRIRISELRRRDWPRGEVRRLYRQIVGMSSPFEAPADFRISLSVPGRDDWLKGIADAEAVTRRALWEVQFAISAEGLADFDYRFRGFVPLKVEGRVVSEKNSRLPLEGPDLELEELTGTRSARSGDKAANAASTDTMAGIGAMHGRFYAFDRDTDTMKHFPDQGDIKRYLDENGGVRVFRDGVRVYNYGERDDDWLGLDSRRVNIPARRLSRNILLGEVHISLESSGDLIEKTNREGFVENEAYNRFSRLVRGVIQKIEAERQKDKNRLRIAAGDPSPKNKGIEGPIAELREVARDAGVGERIAPVIEKIEREYRNMRDTLLQAGMSGMNLAIVFHEVERGVRMLYEGLRRSIPLEQLLHQSEELTKLLDGFATLLRSDASKVNKASTLIRRARDLAASRFRFHAIHLSCPPLEDEKLDFDAKFAFRLALGALNNLIDNSIWWTRIRWPDREGITPGEEQRRILITTTNDLEAGPAIIVADNGAGFSDLPEDLGQPFFSRRPGGIGLGLYYARLTMEIIGGRIEFPRADDLGLPGDYDGAIVALVFPPKEK
jgi:signal transduction histidine kinase